MMVCTFGSYVTAFVSGAGAVCVAVLLGGTLYTLWKK